MFFRKSIYQRSKGWIWASAFLAMLLTPRPVDAAFEDEISPPMIVAEIAIWGLAIAIFIVAALILKKKKREKTAPLSGDRAAPALA